MCWSPNGWTARRCRRSSATGTQAQRDRAGILFTRFLFSGPARAGLLHADPHPGNFRLLDDGRLGVLDFGAVDRLPDGLPPFLGRLLRIMHDPEPDLDEVERELRANGFLRPGISVDLDALRAFLAPMAEPSSVETFKFSREWMRGEATRVTDLSASSVSRRFNLPPSFVLIHRVSTAGTRRAVPARVRGPRSAPRCSAGCPGTPTIRSPPRSRCPRRSGGHDWTRDGPRASRVLSCG